MGNSGAGGVGYRKGARKKGNELEEDEEGGLSLVRLG